METLQLFEIVGFTLDIAGKVMVAFTAVMVHHRFWKEHKVDDKVFRAMKRERRIALWGIAFMIAGFLLQLPGKF